MRKEIDCMACLVAQARGLPDGSRHVDEAGVTHSTLRSMGRSALACTVRRYGRDPEQWSTALATWVAR